MDGQVKGKMTRAAKNGGLRFPENVQQQGKFHKSKTKGSRRKKNYVSLNTNYRQTRCRGQSEGSRKRKAGIQTLDNGFRVFKQALMGKGTQKAMQKKESAVNIPNPNQNQK